MESVECRVWSEKCKVYGVKRKSVKCGVWNAAWKV